MQLQSKECIPTTFNGAKHYFDLLSTQQISDVDLAALTNVQFEAFKDLSKQLFHKEVASHSCSSPANRIKAEIMMQKMGAY
jgi:hypothetical protein